MEKIRYAIIGSGWRAMFFVRIAKALPEQFEVTGMLVRSPEKKQMMEAQHGIFATTSLDELLAAKPDFVAVAVTKGQNPQTAAELMRRGVPALLETPPATSLADLIDLWKTKEQTGGKLQVAEQYFLYPSYEAKLRIVRDGYLGEIQNASVSAVHDYHGISILRLALNAGFSNVRITAKKYAWPVAVTQNRNGVAQKGETAEQGRVRAEFAFDNGTVGFYDFSGVQYHSYVRTRHFSIQGDRGELYDDKVFYLNAEHDPMIETLTPATDGTHPGIESIAFGGKAVYRNPFPTNVLTEDETAIARHLWGMKEYIKTGKELYPLADAMQDAYLTLLLQEAASTGREVRSEDQIWK